MSSPTAREAFDLQGRARRHPRPLRPDPLRPELPAGAPPDRARGPVRHGQHVRDGLQRDHLGHPRLGPVQPDRVLQERGRPQLRQRLHGAARGPRRAGDARQHHDPGLRRVRPDPQGQPGRGPRPSPRLLDLPLRGRARSREGRPSGPPTRRATPPRTARSRPPRSPRPSTRGSGSASTPSCPARRADRSASSITASSRSSELF